MPERRKRRLTLAILTAVPDDYRGRWPFGPQTISFREVAAALGRLGMSCAVVRADGGCTVPSQLPAWQWDGTWRPRPLRRWPDVVYNRVPRRSLERRSDVRGTLRELAREGVPVFNPGFLTKDALYAALAADPAGRVLLPPTRAVGSPDDLEAVLAEWGRVVLKPVDGSLGRKVLVLERDGSAVRCLPGGRDGGRRGRYRDLGRLWRDVPSLARSGRWLAQRPVERLCWQGRPADVRALILRRPDGSWAVTGMAARVAGPGCFVTHVPQGGSRLPLRELLRTLDRGRRAAAAEALEAACLTAVRAVERHLPGIWGELSVDVAVDAGGRPWVLECNAKPMRFDEPEIRRRHLRWLAAFARALAEGWRPKTPVATGGAAVAGA